MIVHLRMVNHIVNIDIVIPDFYSHILLRLFLLVFLLVFLGLFFGLVDQLESDSLLWLQDPTLEKLMTMAEAYILEKSRLVLLQMRLLFVLLQ